MPANDSPHSPTDAILLAAYGSRLTGAQEAMNILLAQATQAFPGHRAEQVFTGGAHFGKGRHAPNAPHVRTPAEVMRTLAREGVQRLAVQSLHIVPGAEYVELSRQVEALRGEFESIALGRPLLGSEEDVRRVAETLAAALGEATRPGEAVLLMGHGTKGDANDKYRLLAAQLQSLGARVLIGAMEAEPGLAEKVAELRGLGVGKVHLMPLLFARGVHVMRDMAGEGEGSWRDGLTRAGFRCEVHLRGAGERPELARIWLDHLREAVASLNTPGS